MPYGNRYSRALGMNDNAWGGAGMNLGIEALAGDSDMITTFDDFNGIMLSEEFNGTTNWEASGWLIADVGSVASETVSMNDPVFGTNIGDFDSCIRLFTGVTEDTGGNMQLDMVNGAVASATSTHDFPHLWIPETATISEAHGNVAAEALDNTTWVFACRIGLKADNTGAVGAQATDWDSKMFIGWARANDPTILDVLTGLPIVTSQTGPIVGFVANEDGSIDGHCQRTVDTALTEGTNFTELLPAGSADGTVANGANAASDTMWFDLALRMDITDMSNDTGNGTTTFFHRGPLNRVSPTNAGKEQLNIGGQGFMPWIEHGTVLTDQTPNSAVALVPSIEALNGPTVNADGLIFVDWWAMGRSRPSR